jgi:hypothetical protein
MVSIQPRSIRSFVSVRNVVAVGLLACAGSLAAQAQDAVPQTANAAPQTFAVVNTRPMDLSNVALPSFSSSSSASDDAAQPADPAASGTLNLVNAPDALQPPPRRRYGSPRYNDSSHNSDGSNKYVFEGGGMLTLPLADTYKYFNTSYAFQVGGGRQFNKKFAVLLQFDYDNFGVNKNTLDSQAALYNGITTPDTGCGPGQGESGCPDLLVDGNNHVWSFTLNPTYTFLQGDKYGAYAVVGAGYYHKVTNFTTPETGEECSIYYGCFDVTENAIFDHYTSNAFGGNLGIGLTYKFSRFAGERFFIEARYVIVDNAQKQGYIYAENTNGYVTNGPNPDPNNAFPANSNKTTYVPIKVGIRF